MKVNACLKKIPRINEISKLAKETKIKVWLVGGFLRDSYLETSKDLIDFDFCVEKNIDLFVKKIAEVFGKKIIVLDKKSSSFRIVVNENNKNYRYDFILMRGKGIKQDLFQRDFTINTLALDITEAKKILDYYGGIKDLRKEKIKTLSDSVINDDPLRILRGFSLASKYGFNIEARTLKIFHLYREKLTKVSYERINEELFKIFNSKRAYKIIKRMDQLRIIDQIIPYVEKMRKTAQGGFHHLNVWDHSIETLKQFEVLCERKIKNEQEVKDFLKQRLSGGRKRGQIIKLACLLHDIGKPFVKKKTKTRTIFHMHEKVGKEISSKIARTMRLSKVERQKITKMVFWHLRPGYLADQVAPSRRAVYRFFRDTQEEGVSVILLSLADWRATRGPLTNSLKRKRHEKVMLKLVEVYFAEKKKKPVPKIINGYELINSLGVKEGPEVGRILTKIKELQVLGKVNKKAEALEAAKDILKKNNKS